MSALIGKFLVGATFGGGCIVGIALSTHYQIEFPDSARWHDFANTILTASAVLFSKSQDSGELTPTNIADAVMSGEVTLAAQTADTGVDTVHTVSSLVSTVSDPITAVIRTSAASLASFVANMRSATVTYAGFPRVSVLTHFLHDGRRLLLDSCVLVAHRAASLYNGVFHMVSAHLLSPLALSYRAIYDFGIASVRGAAAQFNNDDSLLRSLARTVVQLAVFPVRLLNVTLRIMLHAAHLSVFVGTLYCGFLLSRVIYTRTVRPLLAYLSRDWRWGLYVPGIFRSNIVRALKRQQDEIAQEQIDSADARDVMTAERTQPSVVTADPGAEAATAAVAAGAASEHASDTVDRRPPFRSTIDGLSDNIATASLPRATAPEPIASRIVNDACRDAATSPPRATISAPDASPIAIDGGNDDDDFDYHDYDRDADLSEYIEELNTNSNWDDADGITKPYLTEQQEREVRAMASAATQTRRLRDDECLSHLSYLLEMSAAEAARLTRLPVRSSDGTLLDSSSALDHSPEQLLTLDEARSKTALREMLNSIDTSQFGSEYDPGELRSDRSHYATADAASSSNDKLTRACKSLTSASSSCDDITVTDDESPAGSERPPAPRTRPRAPPNSRATPSSTYDRKNRTRAAAQGVLPVGLVRDKRHRGRIRVSPDRAGSTTTSDA